jgi:hypothetical protein
MSGECETCSEHVIDCACDKKMKIEYPIEHVCGGCKKMRKTRMAKHIDIRRRTLINYLCRKCDTSHRTIAKIYEWNQKNLLLREYDKLHVTRTEERIFGKWENVQAEKELFCTKCSHQFDYEEANMQTINPLFGCAPVSWVPFCPKCYPIAEPINLSSKIKYRIQ